MKNELYLFYERKEKSRYRYGPAAGKDPAAGFRCAHCQAFISAELKLACVQNRNHCPYCLWSRHLDLYTAGDRLSACKSLMQPIGLTVKHTHKKYGCGRGELMLIHACMGCEALSINRIAADDDPQRVFSVYKESLRLCEPTRLRMEAEAICILKVADMEMVQVLLFGRELRPAAVLCQC